MAASCRLPGLLLSRRSSSLIFNQSRCSHVFISSTSTLQTPGFFTQHKAKRLPTLHGHPVRLSSQVEEPKETSAVFSTQRVKLVMKQYGPVAVVFHTVISLCSLGGFYLLVKSGLDVPLLLSKVGIGSNQTSAGLSTFGIAYVCHKLFMPVRCFITISSVPLLVRYCRKRGWMKSSSEEPSSN